MTDKSFNKREGDGCPLRTGRTTGRSVSTHEWEDFWEKCVHSGVGGLLGEVCPLTSGRNLGRSVSTREWEDRWEKCVHSQVEGLLGEVCPLKSGRTTARSVSTDLILTKQVSCFLH